MSNRRFFIRLVVFFFWNLVIFWRVERSFWLLLCFRFISFLSLLLFRVFFFGVMGRKNWRFIGMFV